MKKTKIIATYGPAIGSPDKVKQLVSAGVNLFRVNCSYGETKDFIKAANTIRSGTKGALFPVAILFDISGPKLRLAPFTGEIRIKSGELLKVTAGKTDSANRTIAVNHKEIIGSIRKGERVFIDDGNIVFTAVSVGRNQATLKAVNGGTLIGGKGINLPDSEIKLPTITAKDREAIRAAVRAKANYIALSFVRSDSDVKEAQRLIARYGGDQQVIAKLEKKEAIDNLEPIMQVSDGVMIARGDLGVELPFEELPKLQKEIIRLANFYHKPVIVATQMLESMRFSPRATRAEVNDIASAVFDFVDAVMLSAETSTGQYPEKAVRAMERVIVATEDGLTPPSMAMEEHVMRSEIVQAIANAVRESNMICPAKVIFAYTASGFTADMISNLFPSQPIIALTPNRRVMQRLSLVRGVYPVEVKQPESFRDMLNTISKLARQHKLVTSKDKVIVTGGVPFGTHAGTNFMMYYEIPKK